MTPAAYIKVLLFLFISNSFFIRTYSQSTGEKTSFQFIAGKNGNLFGKDASYIENIGQYGDRIPGHAELGKIVYGFEGAGRPVLFTTKAIIFQQRKTNKLTEEQLEEIEEERNMDEEEKRKMLYTDRIITMEWRNANPNPVIEFEEPLPFYYTYGMITGKAKGFKKIIYKEVYPGIDIIYSFVEGKQGFEYSLLVKPGADAKAVSLQFGGDVMETKLSASGDLLITSDIDTIRQSMPLTYYYTQSVGSSGQKAIDKINSGFAVENSIVHFTIADYDRKKAILIDPFVTPTTNFTGMNAAIAKDIDYDYDGNIYVAGGGDLSAGQLAKFSSTGSLLWTFSGRLTTPVSWNFGPNYGGWVVEKTTGKIYLGQNGGSPGFQIIRLNTQGTYDNYITTGNSNFLENWKMIWNCDGGVPKIFIAGGGSSDNINLGVCTPPATVLASLNITGQPGGHQDISDMVIDPKTNELYTIFSQNYVTTITESNRLYKHTTPYAAANKVWTRLSGFTALTERANRPYLSPGLNDNSVNMLAINSHYLFYYDGKNLKAMNKSNGTDAGTAFTFTANTILLQGGIIADECNNIYIGSPNGIIKVYKFNGSGFDDAAAPDITITGFTGPIYDLGYDDAKKLIYAGGNGFVASVDMASYCASNIYKITVTTDCSARSASTSISPALPSGSTITYTLYNGNTVVTTNSNGIFTNLDTTISYTVKALIDKECGGIQALTNFSFSNCSPAIPGGTSGIYVPNVFTPNGDGLNDILKAIPYGIKSFKYFSVYNRFGELVFTTNNFSKGWDGIFKNTKQGTGFFAWIAEGVALDDKPVRVKGTTLLLR